MNKPQSPRRPRGRGPKRNNKGSGAGRGDNRVKGNPKQSLEKYKTMARDALQSGDRVLAEYYFQYADHYQRVCNERFGVASDDEAEMEDAGFDQDEQSQSRRPQRSRSQRAEAASAMERAERVAVESDRSEQPDLPDLAAQTPAVPEKTDADVVAPARPNGRRRPAPRKPRAEALTEEQAEPVKTEDKAEIAAVAGEEPVKPRPRRRRKVAEETVDAAPE